MNNFRFQIILRTLLLFLLLFSSSYFFQNSNFFLGILFLIAALIPVYLIIAYSELSNKELIKFLKGINYSDFTQNITINNLGASFIKLANEMNQVLEKFKTLSFEKEENIKYLQTVVEHVNIGLITFNSKGEIGLINKGAKKILRISYLKNIIDLDKQIIGFGEFLFQIQPNRKSTYKFSYDGESIQLMIFGTEFRLKEQNLKLISLYNIQSELDEKEIEAWQKLIRVLTHEIMNSITPISSLATTADSLIKNSPDYHSEKEWIKDIVQALKIIQKRSEGLGSFVNKFRDISKIPKPNFQTINVSELFFRIRLLTEPIISDTEINISFSIKPENLEIIGDPDLIEQVFINLINNSVQALSETKNPVINVTAEIDEKSGAVFKVKDNGIGISENVIDRIFVPFFTTKQEGSGIGLSISQTIIKAHNGNIWVESSTNSTTTFSIRL
ncbi:hypothetical protein APF79_03930 [bacterium BRH_c32]|nr:MAG: hypothetical protein APF79_03930 [bacterium BRH_c32]